MSDESDATTPESGASAEAVSAEAVSVEPVSAEAVSEPGADAGTADTETATAGTEPAGTEPAGTEPADTEAEEAEPVPPGRWSRMLPPRLRRRPLITAIAAVGLAALIAVLVLAAVQPSTPRPAYSSLPKQPCSLISPAELAKFLPGAKGTAESVHVGGSVRIDTCKWSSTTGGDDQTLVGQVLVFGASTSISDAQLSYRASVSRLRCRCKGVTISTRPVTGLGDEAAEVYVSAAPTANFVSSPNAGSPGAHLLVRSSNAMVFLDLDTTASATGASTSPPPSQAQLAGMISLARGMLADLSRPVSVSPAAASAAAEPHYAGRRDPCKLIASATLARYVPGATLSPIPNPSGPPSATSASTCSWGSDDTLVLLNLDFFSDAASAGQNFQDDAGISGRGGNGVTVTGMQALNDLGETAQATFRTQGGNAGVDLLVWSGNAELDYSISDHGYKGASKRDRATLLAGVIAMARDGLAALASRSASAYPTGPHYALPHDPCRLVRSSTLARYAPGATVEHLPAASGTDMNDCAWAASNGNLFLSVTTYSDLDSAQGGLQFDVQFARKNQGGTAYKGQQPVNDLGQQAVAIFEITEGNSPTVDLYVWSGNVVVDMSYSDVPFGSPPDSRAGKLAADIAMARDVLAGLRPS